MQRDICTCTWKAPQLRCTFRPAHCSNQLTLDHSTCLVMVPALLFWALAHTSSACVVGGMRLGHTLVGNCGWLYSPARATDQHCRPFVCFLHFCNMCLPNQIFRTGLCACLHNCVCAAVTSRTNSRHGPTLNSPWSCACCSTQVGAVQSTAAAYRLRALHTRSLLLHTAQPRQNAVPGSGCGTLRAHSRGPGHVWWR